MYIVKEDNKPDAVYHFIRRLTSDNLAVEPHEIVIIAVDEDELNVWAVDEKVGEEALIRYYRAERPWVVKHNVMQSLHLKHV